MKTKVCTKCGIEKELSSNFFMIAKVNKDSLSGRCRECTLAYKRQYYKKNVENSKQYYKDNLEHRLAYKKQYDIDNFNKVSEYHKKYSKLNSEKLSRYSKKYNADNREKVIKQQHQYAKDNKEKIATRKKKYVLDNIESVLIYRKQYLKDNALQYRMRNEHRRALEKSLPSTLTLSQWEKIKKNFDNKCAYCGKESNLVQEHFLALSKGGEYTTNNIIPSCQTCNNEKYNKDFFEWYPTHKYYSKKREQIILKYLNYKNKIQQLTLAI